MFAPDRYVTALRFAADRHRAQLVPGTDLPYLVHVTSVAAEVIAVLPNSGLDADLAVGCALLHDVLEDTAKTDDERGALAARISEILGPAVAAGVWALTKNDKGMSDSLRRIKEQPHAVWVVKLADRITNLAPPPGHWTRDKKERYRAEAIVIADELGAANAALDARIRAKIDTYATYF